MFDVHPDFKATGLRIKKQWSCSWNASLWWKALGPGIHVDVTLTPTTHLAKCSRCRDPPGHQHHSWVVNGQWPGPESPQILIPSSFQSMWQNVEQGPGPTRPKGSTAYVPKAETTRQMSSVIDSRGQKCFDEWDKYVLLIAHTSLNITKEIRAVFRFPCPADVNVNALLLNRREKASMDWPVLCLPPPFQSSVFSLHRTAPDTCRRQC